jgi:uncharacterized protein (TIGR03067 family)
MLCIVTGGFAYGGQAVSGSPQENSMHALLALMLFVPADITKDTANLQGTWVVVSASAGGKPEDEIKGDKLTFKDNTITVKTKNKEERGTFKLDPAKKPAEIDITEEGKDKPMPGIYVLEGDTLKLCIVPTAGMKRPTEFASKEGTEQMVIELKREKK